MLYISQSSHIKNILNKFNMSERNFISTLLESQLDFEALILKITYDAPFRNLMGCFMYRLLCTRPDLCTAISILCRYINNNNKDL